ncbi:MAG: hypothetical protein PHF00_11070, partial [Elusimicrobia bacterium]|nr:hypothetical protein [Elusimicrobiota bacterium]
MAAAAAVLYWGGPEAGRAVCGLGCAWLLSTASLAALLSARAVSPRAFWFAFWGGMGTRGAALAAFMAAAARERVSAALLLGYALGMIVLLPL